MSTVTIVTALIDPSNVQSTTDLEVYLERFKIFVETGFANLVAYVSPHILERCIEMYPSVTFRPVVFEELQAYKIASFIPHTLPVNRSEAKDTENYMLVINSKTELVTRTINDEKLTSTSHYAWIDFGISKIFKDPEASFASVKAQLESGKLTDRLAIPGCWDGILPGDEIVKRVCWRYCGGFFVGDKRSLLDFDRLAIMALTDLLQRYHVLVWEVNLWSYMSNYGWRPDWYQALHDEGMFALPSSMTK